jgi:hypothetical protein
VPGAGRRVIDLEESKRLRERARLAVGYLVRHTRSDGSFTYIYDVANRSPENSRYNLVRHSGTLMELFRCVGSEFDHGDMLASASANWDYLRSFFHDIRIRGEQCICVAQSGLARLGGTALTLLALGNGAIQVGALFDDRQLIAKLARYVLSQQLGDGTFVSKTTIKDNVDTGFRSAYYPGEAVLALCMAFRLTGDSIFLEGAVRGGLALTLDPVSITAAPGGFTQHWLMRSLSELGLLTGDPEWRIVLRDMSSRLCDDDGTWMGKDPPWLIGGLTTNIATRVEGLLASLSLDVLSGDLDNASKVASICLRALNVCFQNQSTPQNPRGGDPAGIGGLFQSTESSDIRIDFVHHPLGAALTYLSVESDLQIRSPRQQVATSCKVRQEFDWTLNTPPVNTGETCARMVWAPEGQYLAYGGHEYKHKGTTRTHPSHDIAHLLVALTTSLPWLPGQTSPDVKKAEYNAVFLEHFLDNVYNSSTLGSIDPQTIVTKTLEYMQWFVTVHYAPFPGTPYQAFCELYDGLDATRLCRLSATFFLAKQLERRAPFSRRKWVCKVSPNDEPALDHSGKQFIALVRLSTSALGERRQLIESLGVEELRETQN